jgi:hypothetical protein
MIVFSKVLVRYNEKYRFYNCYDIINNIAVSNR